MSEQIGVGIIGLGAISEAHIQAIKENKDLRLIGVTNRSSEKAEKVAQWNNCKMYQNSQDLIRDEEIDLVVMLTPPGKHEELITACAMHGKHILAEKPIGTDMGKINEYLGLCEEKSVKVAVVSQHRFDASAIFAKRKMEAKALGKPSLANCVVNWFRDDQYYDSWHNEHQMAGGGVLAIQAIHTIDLMISFMGKIESVKGFTTQIREKKLGVEDTAAACIKFSNGALGVISATTSAHPGSPSRLELMGDKGSLTITGEDISFYKSEVDAEEYEGNRPSEESSFLDPGKISIESLGAQYDDVVQSIKQNKEPIVSGRIAKETYAVIDAIYRSSKTGKEIYMQQYDKSATKQYKSLM